MNGVRRMSLVTGLLLVVAGCGATASPAPSVPPSATASASPSRAPSPSPSAAVAAACSKVPKPFDPKHIDLSGAWAGDDDGIYYLRQVGTVLWWNGMSERDGTPAALGRDWNNVGRGEIDGLKIAVDWADVPRGQILGGGTMDLTIEDDGTGNVHIVKSNETGTGFGNSIWTYCEPD
jgi:hypothetical protein